MLNIVDKDYKLLFYFILIAMLLFTIFDPGLSIKFAIQADENFYQTVVKDWNANGLNLHIIDTKPLSFYYLERLLKIDKTIQYSRILNILLIISVSFMMYRMTGRKEAGLYVIIPFFLNSMWLTVEIIEVFFVILSLQYLRYRGVFIGLAALFRPYAVLYSILINNKQRVYMVLIGLAFSLILIYQGLFFPYANHLFNYAVTNHNYDEVDIVAMIGLGLLFIAGSRNKEMMRYSVLASIPLAVKLYGHYFLPAYSFLFLGCLLSMEKRKDK